MLFASGLIALSFSPCFSSLGFSPQGFSLTLFALSFLHWDFCFPMAFDLRLSALPFSLGFLPWAFYLGLFILRLFTLGFQPCAFCLELFALGFLLLMAFDVKLSVSPFPHAFHPCTSHLGIFILGIFTSGFQPCAFCLELFALGFILPTAFDLKLSASCFSPWTLH